MLIEICSLSSSTLLSKNNTRPSKKWTKSKWVRFNYTIWLMTMKMRLKTKNRSQKYDINWPRLRHGHEHTKYKMCLSIMMVICIKQHLRNIWSQIHEKVKATLEKHVAYQKSVYFDVRVQPQLQ